MAATPTQWKALITHQDQLTQDLIIQLDAEREALEHYQADTVKYIAGEKQSLLSKLERLNKVSQHWLAEENLPATAEALDEYFKQCDPTNQHQLIEKHQQLKTNIDICRKKNTINGHIIASSQQTTRRVLHLLLGDDKLQTQYNRQGYLNSPSRSDIDYP